MTVCIPKLTFRIHDNPLLGSSNICVVILQQERFPTHNYQQSNSNKCWSYHQFNLLIQTLIQHQNDLNERQHASFLHVLAVKENQLALVLRQLKRDFSHCVTDYTTDPAFNTLDATMSEVYGDELQVIATHTLLDWREKPHSKVLAKYWSKAKPFSKLTPLKQHIIQHLESRGLAQTVATANGSKTEAKLPKSLNKYQVDLAKLLGKIQQEMMARDMYPHDFSFGNDNKTGYDEGLLQHAQDKIRRIDYEDWYKPNTAPAINWGCQAQNTDTDTTQLSPFLSIGSLSARAFWQLIQNPNTDTGSLKDQLLWRECFHATAIAADLLSGRGGRISHFWDGKGSKFVDPKTYDWQIDRVTLERWYYGRLAPEQDNFEAQDTNEAMCQLYQNGWIHHLRRHLVADVLTRGRLGQHWLKGEAWFRHTLLDHDAPVNRANWMWLAAVAFSSKQKVYHYSPQDYVTRRSQGTGKITCG